MLTRNQGKIMRTIDFESSRYCNKGQESALLERYEEAIVYFDKAVTADSKNVDAWHYKGIALKCLQRYPEAIVCLNIALSLDRSNKQVSHQITKVTRLRVDELAVIVHSEDVPSTLRIHAAEELGNMKDPNAIDPLLRVLPNGDREIRSTALEALNKFHISWPGQYMSALTYASDCSTLDLACRQFVESRVDYHVNRCMDQLISDPDLIYMKNRLKQFSRVSARALVENFRHKKEGYRVAAAEILIDAGEIAAILPLIKLLKHRKAATRALAAFTLHSFGDADTLARSIIRASDMTVPRKIGLFEALKHIHTRAVYQGMTIQLNYHLPAINEFCNGILEDSDVELAAKASAIKHATELLTPVQRDAPGSDRQLLRTLQNKPEDDNGEALLRPDPSVPPELWRCEYGHLNTTDDAYCPKCRPFVHKVNQASKHLHAILIRFPPRSRKSDDKQS